jgi:hypothetical protein
MTGKRHYRAFNRLLSLLTIQFFLLGRGFLLEIGQVDLVAFEILGRKELSRRG